MNPIYVVSKLSPKTTAFNSSGGVAEYDQALCAALTKGVKPKHLNAFKLKYCHDYTCAYDLGLQLWDEALMIASREGWHRPKGKECVRRMADLAIAEVALPRYFNSDVARAAFVGMEKTRWHRIGRHQYELVYLAFEEWCSEAFRVILDNQRGDESD